MTAPPPYAGGGAAGVDGPVSSQGAEKGVCVGLVRPRLWARGETSAGLLAPGQARAQDLVTSMGMPGPIVVVIVALRM